MGILRTDRVSGLGGANAIKGSVEMRGAQNLRAEIVNSNADFNLGSSDFTIECWLYRGGTTGTTNSLDQDLVMLWNNTNNRRSYGLYYDSGGYLGLIGSSDGTNSNMQSYHSYDFPDANAWYHIAAVRISNTATVYVNGTSIGSATVSGSFYENTQDNLVIGGQLSGTNYDNKIVQGFLSNVRLIIGDGIYTGAFTPPTSELTVTANTKLLCCQSPGNVLQEATGKTLVAYRSSSNDSFPLASHFTPNSPVGFSTTTDVGTQFGSTFDGVTTFDSQAYMVPPGGNTRERNRGRGLIGQGKNTTSPSNIKGISFIEIQSGGTAFDFGDSTNGSMYAMTAVSSSTRAVFAGGHTSQASPYPVTNLIEFVTIATTSNCTDFGDLDVGAAHRNGASNQTRGLIAAGYSPNTRQIDKIEIATLGNATDYGDLTDQGFYGLNQGGMVSSTTRGLFAGGSGNSAPVAVNTITFSLFSTSGNSTNFGDLTHTNAYFNVGNSNGVRGVFMGGADIDSPYAVTDQIDFVTIATAGNASDFGSLNTARYNHMGASNSTRGVIAGGRISPAPTLPVTNHMEFITITSTGNGSDFGELIEPERAGAGCSDSHGGLE